MDIIGWFDHEILKEATRLGGEGAARDQLVVFAADILPFLAVVIGGLLFISGKTPRQRERNQEVMLIALGAVLIAVGIRYVIGLAIERPRPFITYPEIHHVGLSGSSTLSFPSLHAFLLFTLAGVIFFIGQHRRWAVILLLIATVVAIARVVAGVHYPSDVLAGTILGLGLAKLLSWQSRWVDRQLR